MKTARMSSAPVWTTNATTQSNNNVLMTRDAAGVCSDAELDAYAQRILEKHAARSAGHSQDNNNNNNDDLSPLDDSLGAYVTSVLRMAGPVMVEDVKLLPDFEGLIDLLQEHCGLPEESQAQEALQEIATLVARGRFPNEETTFPGMQVLQTALPPVMLDDEEYPTLSQAVEQVAPKGCSSVLSPHRADSLIPLDLLDDPDVDGSSTAVDTTEHTDGSHPDEGGGGGGGTSDAADGGFPPLSASAAAATEKKATRSVSKKSKPQQQPATDLAAALFRPARSRQSSIDETSPKLQATTSAAAIPDPYIDPQHYEAVVSMLLTMNMELSHDAAYEAAVLAQADVNVAQYLVEAAMTAPPICRHLLQSGCYRSDCQFSHDLEGHTCIFWLRGRCGKGETCRFLHGFSEKLLQDVIVPAGNHPAGYGDGSTYYPSSGVGYTSAPPPPPTTSFGGYSMASPPTATSWMQPSAMNTPDVVPTTAPPSSFANIAFQGYSMASSFAPSSWNAASTSNNTTTTTTIQNLATAKIPQDLWNPHENRDANVFHIADPMERYQQVMSMSTDNHHDYGLIDLHFQSIKTFDIVLSHVLPEQLQHHDQVWIVTGTGHHVGAKTHQKGGGALETAVLQWLLDQGYHNNETTVYRGRDRNGQGGGILVKR